MTFAEWYAANVEPGVIQTVNGIPDKAARELTLKAARDSMAACWNAALQAIFELSGRYVTGESTYRFEEWLALRVPVGLEPDRPLRTISEAFGPIREDVEKLKAKYFPKNS